MLLELAQWEQRSLLLELVQGGSNSRCGWSGHYGGSGDGSGGGGSCVIIVIRLVVSRTHLGKVLIHQIFAQIIYRLHDWQRGTR